MSTAHPDADAASQARPEGSSSSTTTTTTTTTTTSHIQTEAATSPRKDAQLTLEQYQEIYDRLIKIFMERPRDDWKKLIVFSKQWAQHSNGIFNRWVPPHMACGNRPQMPPHINTS